LANNDRSCVESEVASDHGTRAQQSLLSERERERLSTMKHTTSETDFHLSCHQLAMLNGKYPVLSISGERSIERGPAREFYRSPSFFILFQLPVSCNFTYRHHSFIIGLFCWQMVKQSNKCLTVHGACMHGVVLLMLYLFIHLEFDRGLDT